MRSGMFIVGSFIVRTCVQTLTLSMNFEDLPVRSIIVRVLGLKPAQYEFIKDHPVPINASLRFLFSRRSFRSHCCHNRSLMQNSAGRGYKTNICRITADCVRTHAQAPKHKHTCAHAQTDGVSPLRRRSRIDEAGGGKKGGRIATGMRIQISRFNALLRATEFYTCLHKRGRRRPSAVQEQG